MKCKKCGIENDIDAMFCEGCGVNLKEPVIEKKCPSCNQNISDDSVFCENCGCDLTEKQTKDEEILIDKNDKLEKKEKSKVIKEKITEEEVKEDLSVTKKVKDKKPKKTSRKPKVLVISLAVILLLLLAGFGTYVGVKLLKDDKVINEKVSDTNLMNVYVFTFKDSVYGKEIIDYLNEDYSKKINVVVKDVFNKEEDLKLLEKLGKELEFETNKTPIIIVSDKFFIGASDEIKTEIDLELKSVLEAKEYVDMISNINSNKNIHNLIKIK